MIFNNILKNEGHQLPRTDKGCLDYLKVRKNTVKNIKNMVFNEHFWIKPILVKDLEEMLQERDYQRANFKDIKAEHDELREKLRELNQKLNEKVESS